MNERQIDEAIAGITGQILGYHASRDAMASALETLSANEWRLFFEDLYHRQLNGRGFRGNLTVGMTVLQASPKQLAIAFLKAKGKWRDDRDASKESVMSSGTRRVD